MNILIITLSRDNDSIQTVQDFLEQDGHRVFRLNSDLYPTDIFMTAKYVAGNKHLYLKSPDFEVDLNTIDAIWYRRLDFGLNLPKDLEQQIYQASIQEAKRTMMGMIDSLQVFTIDPYTKIRYTENKQLQLQIASQLGFEIPKTIFTNDEQAVKDFCDQVGAPIITKMQHSFAIYENGEENVVFTNEITKEQLNDLEGLDLCPMTFQEKVEKKLELRLTIVGNKIFTASIDPKLSALSHTDWRRDGRGLSQHWEIYELPEAIAQKVLQLMDTLGLNYGAADIIVTPDDRYVFLEVNPAGEFFWLDKLFDHQISKALAGVLANRLPRRANSIPMPILA
ncbi:MAG: MvdC/MvdD family ATP grasp protein [Flammeovirgaceae bacterium]